MSLNRLFWLISILLMLLFLTLIGRIVSSEWSVYKRSTKSMPAIGNLQLALLVEEKLAAERGPSNSMLTQGLDDAAEAFAALERARSASDQSLAALRHALQVQADPLRAPAQVLILAQVESTQQALAAARKEADLLLARQKPQRDLAAVGAAQEMMAHTVGVFAPAITILSGIAVQSDAQLSDGLQGAQLISSLRNIAGEIGSVFIAPVVARRPLSSQEIYAFSKLSGEIEQLYSVIELQLHTYHDNPAVEIALNTVRDQYLGAGLGFLNELFFIGRSTGDYGLSARDVTARYVPEMAAIPHLRDLVLAEMLKQAEYKNRQATYVLLAATCLGVIALGIFMLLMRVIRQRVLRPILDATDLFTSLAEERLSTAIPVSRHDDEIGAMMRAIHVLKAHSLAKVRLEQQREELIAQLQTLSDTDFLTGLLNRRAFFSQGEQQFGIAQRYRRQLVLILMDVDHFKAVNDRYGHPAGDLVLRGVADLCRRYCRKVDLLARYGGEEFVVLLPEIDLSQALAAAEKLRSAIDACHLQLDDGQIVNVTASFGVAAFDCEAVDCDKSLESLIERADQALYQAKHGGRNMVVASPQRKFDASFSLSDGPL
ncbi:diguanylate cyclase (GGDEF) domain-containing protein [Collimonas sp. OK242]|uniref:GGDEF domain-containing protein n=1 Tax=Collimonas sp. OK242 TaxID=1798195 RepID=UPI0008941DA0|nr:GGDEF domain-containing protein [Collimonas sp. OK242]SDX74730.1 diguanylate cyclase (GGDEF) domain-containing protein [Collimonas sp. OK242]